METIPVVFRFDDVEVTAVFPSMPEGHGEWRCYAHIGQHGACSRGWYAETRPAKPHEYADLLDELRGIYDDPGISKLEVVLRANWKV